MMTIDDVGAEFRKTGDVLRDDTDALYMYAEIARPDGAETIEVGGMDTEAAGRLICGLVKRFGPEVLLMAAIAKGQHEVLEDSPWEREDDEFPETIGEGA